MNDRYILNDAGEAVAEPDLMKWAQWFDNFDNRRVAKDEINGVHVSTVFLGLDHKFDDEGDPVLWETMVFGGKLHDECDRCAGNRKQAEAMHAAMVEKVKAA